MGERCSWKLLIIGTPFGRLDMRARVWRTVVASANELEARGTA
jgi:hypothetical protein